MTITIRVPPWGVFALIAGAGCAPGQAADPPSRCMPAVSSELGTAHSPLLFEISPNVVMPGDQFQIAGAGFGDDTRLEGLGDSVVFQRMDEGSVVGTFPSGSGVAFVGARTSEGGGSNKVPISFGDGLVGANQGLSSDGWVHSIAATTGPTPMVYAATTGGVYRSTDNGITWQRRSLGLQQAHVWSIVASPQAPECLYACTEDGQVFKSYNHGQAWQPIRQPLFGEPHCGLRAHPTDPNQVFATNNGWTFRWNGATWSSFSDLRVSIASVVERYIYAVPYPIDQPPGLWRFDLDTGQPEV
ncbi:MAG TPA: hypothetical protein VIG99_14605, partial [Myxococcaceae bacterium]